MRALWLFLFLLFAAAAPARIIIIPPPPEPPVAPLELRAEKTSVAIDEGIAKTTFRQTYYNSHPAVREGMLLFTVPAGANLTDFIINLDGRELAAEVLDKDEALRIYTEIVRKTQDPGLLEHIDGRTYRARLFPIAAGGEAHVEIRLVAPVQRQNNLWIFNHEPLGSHTTTERVKREFSIELAAKEKLRLISSPTHELNVEHKEEGKSARITLAAAGAPNDPFTLHYDVETDELGIHFIAHKPEKDKEGTFLLTLSPPRTGELSKAVKKDVVFVLDTSGSMNEQDRMEKAKGALRQSISGLHSEDRIGLIGFSTDVDIYLEEMRVASDENIKKAREWVGEKRARGGTNIHDALVAAGKMLASVEEPNPLRQVVLLTDGYPTVGLTDRVQIESAFESNAPEGTRLFTVGFGYEVNAVLLDALAENSRGLPFYVHPNQDLELAVSDLFAAISHAVLTDLNVTFEGIPVRDLYPRPLPDLYHGRSLVLTGTYSLDLVSARPSADHGAMGTIRLKGKAGEENYETSMRVEFPNETDRSAPHIRTIWAQRKIAYLLDEIRKNHSQELIDEVTRLSKEHGIVTPYTSYLAVPDELYSHMPNAPQERADSRRRMVSAAQTPTGESAIRFSQQNAMQKQSSTVSSSMSFDSALPSVIITDEIAAGAYTQARAENRIQNIDGVWLTKNAEGKWIDQSLRDPKQEPIKIQYLSPAYFALLENFPGKRRAILAGEQVVISLHNQTVEIGPEGAAEALPEELR